MSIVKRASHIEPFDGEKLNARVQRAFEGLSISPDEFLDSVKYTLPAQIKAEDLEDLLARTAASLSVDHPDFTRVAARIYTDSMHKKTPPSFSEATRRLYAHRYNGQACPLVSSTQHRLVAAHADALDAAIRPERDSDLTYFGLRTLARAYLLASNDKAELFETPQYLFMRVAVAVNVVGDELDLEGALRSYDLFSRLVYTHATPTLFNAGTPKEQLSSCFLLTMKSDSIEGIFDTLHDCARISKYAGGIGLSVSQIRGTNSYIRGTNGHSNGLVPMLRVFNDTARYIDQGGGKRKGSFAIYLEPWHTDVLEFLELRLPTGKEEARCRDLFLAMFVNDIFMERVRADATWSLFCPDRCPGLVDAYGDEFSRLYMRYEKEGRASKTVKAQDVWMKILTSQVETGTPYMLFKNACNAKSNQKNLGTIRSSNLCCEVVEYSSDTETAVCNLASISLPKLVKPDRTFDFAQLEAVVRVIVTNLNRVIDRNMYPIPSAKRSNTRHRPVGIGVQALADALIAMRIVYDSPEGIQTDRDIFETIYYAAISASCDLAAESSPYETFPGSPMSEGLFQFDLWNETEAVYASGRYGRAKWEALKARVKEKGVRNSLLVAPMPTATTSQILGNFTESFQPLPSVLYQRRTLSGDFVLCHPQFIRDMIDRGKWDRKMLSKIEFNNGTLDGIDGIPDDVRRLYRSCWEMKQRFVVDHSVARGPFICQSQSMNIFMENPTSAKLTALHFYTWSHGLKTGMYYLRSQSKTHTIKFGAESGSSSRGASLEECETCGS